MQTSMRGMRVWCVVWVAISDWDVVWYARLMISFAGIRTSTIPWTLLLPSLPLVDISSLLPAYGHVYAHESNVEVPLLAKVYNGERLLDQRPEVSV